MQQLFPQEIALTRRRIKNGIVAQSGHTQEHSNWHLSEDSVLLSYVLPFHVPLWGCPNCQAHYLFQREPFSIQKPFFISPERPVMRIELRFTCLGFSLHPAGDGWISRFCEPDILRIFQNSLNNSYTTCQSNRTVPVS